MADTKKGNVAKHRKSNVASKKGTKKEQAQRIGRSPRSVRHENYRGGYIEAIREKVYPTGEEYEGYSDVFLSIFPGEFAHTDRKQGISLPELKLLSELPRAELVPIYEKLKEVKQNGGNLKEALQGLLPDHKTKVTVTVPAYVNQWYTEQASYRGMSKGAYLSWVMVKIYEVNKDRK